VGSDPGSLSPYVRARGVGEGLVKGAFEGVTILRPSVIFGPGDSFFNTLANMARRSPVLPLFGMGNTVLQPVFVGDVAEACVKALVDPVAQGKTYELGGPRRYTYKALLQLVRKQVDRKRLLVPVPFFVWNTLAAFMACLPNPPLTRDQVKLMKQDNVIKENTLTLEDLGIHPISVEEVLPTYISP
jgi:NADH dehydrogenase